MLMQKIFLLPYEKPVSSNKITKYAAKIKSIMYAMLKTWIDIIFAMLIVSLYTKNPKPDQFSTMNQILRYFVGSLEKNIKFRGESKLNLIRYYSILIK